MGKDIIRQLPDTVANQIAAGEVIQRPASALKELVENAVDAGATEITIRVKDAGRTLLQVIDNGKGMSHMDARMAFERHATSKITCADDLFKLRTMGFRGEALPSICAISQVELRTCQRDSDVGTRLLISGGKMELHEADTCSAGTNISVRNLFYNVPARRKFLKSDTWELNLLTREFEKLALVNPGIKFVFDNGSRVADFRAGTLKQRIEQLWKKSPKTLMKLEEVSSMIRLYGFITDPAEARPRGALQYLIVNGRNMNHPYFRKVIEECYKPYIAPDTHPSYFVIFEVDPGSIDVNISPTKSDVKFENEAMIAPLLKNAVRTAIGRNSLAHTIDFNNAVLNLDPARDGDFVKAPGIQVDPDYNPFAQSSRPFSHTSGSAANLQRSPTKDWEKLFENFKSDRNASQPTSANTATADSLEIETDVTPLCIQYANKYLVTPGSRGLMLIDQYRAHVKILFERFMKAGDSKDATHGSQNMLFPEPVTLSASQMVLIEALRQDLHALGFRYEATEGGEVRILAAPSILNDASPADVLTGILAAAEDGSSAYGTLDVLDRENIRRQMALALARASAIRGGQRLTSIEMEKIVAELFTLPDPMHTPTGQNVYVELGDEVLLRGF